MTSELCSVSGQPYDECDCLHEGDCQWQCGACLGNVYNCTCPDPIPAWMLDPRRNGAYTNQSPTIETHIIICPECHSQDWGWNEESERCCCSSCGALMAVKERKCDECHNTIKYGDDLEIHGDHLYCYTCANKINKDQHDTATEEDYRYP